MRKSCGKCMYSKNITSENISNGYIVDNRVVIDKDTLSGNGEKIICTLNNSIHKRNKEQRKCKDFDIGG